MSTVLCRAHVLALLLLVTTVAAQELPKSQPPVWSAKPDVAAFEKMENDRLAAVQRAIDKIVAVKGLRTIENTLAPYDEAIRQLNAASYFSGLMQQVHPDVAFRDHATTMTTTVSSAQTALSLNRDVYQALSSLDVSKADAVTRYYVQRQLLEFRLAGVDKDDATRTRLKKLNDQLTEDQSMFDRNIADGKKIVEITDASELDGLPQDYIDAHKPGTDGKIHITTDYPDVFPALTFAKSDGLRRRLWEAFQSRAYPKNRDVLRDMMQTRYEIATLIGYSSWADYNAADKMIMNGKNVAKFIQDLDATTRPVAEREFAMLLAEKRKTDPGATEIPSYDFYRISELVRRSQYDFDSQTVRPYLPYDRVKKGVMDTAATLFHISFRQELNVPAWDPSVETWDVIENGKAIGRIYLDMHPRPGKYSHAEMAPVLDGIRDKQLPEAILVCNFPAPTANDPGLMDYGDVVTFFHEFGHLMHWTLGGRQSWAGISGISMESDFTEAPSQLLEEWMHSPQVLASFAHHYKTGEPIPADLVTRMNRASAFGRANGVARQDAYAAISYDIYKDNPQKVDLDALTLDDLRHYALFIPIAADAHMYASFTHLGGYSSAVYTYMWDKVIAEDFFQQFDQNNLLAGDAPMRYRRLVLEPGGSMSANDLVKNFLGRAQNMTAFQRWMGEEFESTP
ncbi:MAG: M3 family metallopeptidase [Terriglobales bacterium]|jgi:Zn-dependent oligopeptidase